MSDLEILKANGSYTHDDNVGTCVHFRSDIQLESTRARRRAEKQASRGPGHPYARRRAPRFIFDWFYFMRVPHRSHVSSTCPVTEPSPCIPMTVLMEWTNVSFTNQQRSVTARERGIIEDPRTLLSIIDHAAVIFGRTRHGRGLQMDHHGKSRQMFPKHAANIRAPSPANLSRLSLNFWFSIEKFDRTSTVVTTVSHFTLKLSLNNEIKSQNQNFVKRKSKYIFS